MLVALYSPPAPAIANYYGSDSRQVQVPAGRGWYFLEAAARRGWSLRRLRERVLKAAARVQRHARRLHVILERRAATLWRKLLGRRHRWRLAA